MPMPMPTQMCQMRHILTRSYVMIFGPGLSLREKLDIRETGNDDRSFSCVYRPPLPNLIG